MAPDLTKEEAARSAARIRSDLERARTELASSVEALRDEVARAVDWRVWYRKRAGIFLIGAFTVGFIIGTRRR